MTTDDGTDHGTAAATFTAIGDPGSLPAGVTVRDEWIPMPDGVRLHARIWAPRRRAAGRPRSPVLLEYLPYRLDDWTAPRDSERHPWYAAARVRLGPGRHPRHRVVRRVLRRRVQRAGTRRRRGRDRLARRAAVVDRRRRHVRHLVGRVQRAAARCPRTRRAQGDRDRLLDGRPVRQRRALRRRRRARHRHGGLGRDDVRVQLAAAPARGRRRRRGSTAGASASRRTVR